MRFHFHGAKNSHTSTRRFAPVPLPSVAPTCHCTCPSNVRHPEWKSQRDRRFFKSLHIHPVSLLPPTRSLMTVWSHSRVVWRLRRHNRSEKPLYKQSVEPNVETITTKTPGHTLTFAGNSHWNCWHLAGAGSGHRGLSAIYLQCEPSHTHTHTQCYYIYWIQEEETQFLLFFSPQCYRKAIPTCVTAPHFCLW